MFLGSIKSGPEGLWDNKAPIKRKAKRLFIFFFYLMTFIRNQKGTQASVHLWYNQQQNCLTNRKTRTHIGECFDYD